MSWVFLLLAILIEVTGTVSLQASAVTGRRAFLPLTAVCYVASYGFLTLVLRAGMGLGVAYGIWTAAGVALTAVASRVLFAERFTPLKSLGVALIIGGVLLVEFGS
ncbi:multidrug efflux SMR transporter [uncultured Corynebacterium sp.]|uniref:DMT family transporter n=1 Tax=uncultured Corynebacterium sp. TaxID=159447 RepID=UPI0025EEC6F5|nr:multidrug efflux SMR transporter [uncultured Corynebacterium sp.]